ncbi:helix-turn-helix domain-containing protein [Nocardia niigatensis]
MVTVSSSAPGQLAEFIKARRQELDLLGKDLAQRAGLSPSTVSRIEQGVFAHPTPECLRAIAEALNVPADHLLTLAASSSKPKVAPKTPRTPRIRISYQDVSPEAARELFAAIDPIAHRHLLNSSHEFTYSDHQRDHQPGTLLTPATEEARQDSIS